ncbi:MAG: hypothetical protein KatS3mg030_270 [Saprospiraceae bacterium]|nr:MAG: hypothetical protein KatS3mg030_270 [Saprospiraceae bacterium]
MMTFLKPAHECLVFFEMPLVLVGCGGANGAQFATGQGRLEDVGGVHGAVAAPGAHEGVDFVDEQDDLAIALLHLLDDGFEAFFELTFVLGASDEGGDVEGVDFFASQVFRHVLFDDAPGDALDDGGFANAWFTDEDGVVLFSA